MSARRAGILAFAGIMGVGVLLRYTVVPSEEKLMSRLSPEVRAELEKNKEKRRANHEAIMEQMIESSKSDKPIWDVAKEHTKK